MEATAQEDARRAAYHEAGHAVIAVVLGVPVRTITIAPDAEALGRVALSDLPREAQEALDSRTLWDHPRALLYGLKRIVVALSGAIVTSARQACRLKVPKRQIGMRTAPGSKASPLRTWSRTRKRGMHL